MEVLFADRRLRNRLSSKAHLVTTYGDVVAKRATQRFQELRAAGTLADMRNLPGKCHELTGDRTGQLAVHLDARYRLIFRPADNPPPTKADGGLDWDAVTEIVVIAIVDYH